MVNAFNLIDGLNGLSSYISISIVASTIVSFDVGTRNSQFSSFYSVLRYWGFQLNFPFGKIFLGDGGAYAGTLTCMVCNFV